MKNGKEEMCKVSVLVPVYNVENYLDRCVRSVLLQQFTDWEMILVDDGSPDKCPQMCDEYALKDTRIRVVHKKNGGLPSARLAGFEKARGEYFVFLDSDDWLLDGALATLYDAITSDGGYDVVKSVPKRVTEDGREWLEHFEIESGVIGSSEEFTRSLQSDKMQPYVHSGMYRADLFDSNSFLPIVKSGVSMGEDWFVNFAISKKVNRLKFINTPTTVYFINTSSIMGESIFGWDYLERLHRCTEEISRNIGFQPSAEYIENSALGELKYFFVPEIPFQWNKFKELQPLMIRAIKRGGKWYNKNNARFIEQKYLFFIYAHIYKLLFFVFKLRCHKRKVLR